jgi:hypothetical protein
LARDRFDFGFLALLMDIIGPVQPLLNVDTKKTERS